jgi:SagB-type dehydrogenase family enzyme
MLSLDDSTTLSLLFHLNSEPWLNDEAYRGGAETHEFKRPAGILREVALARTGLTPLTALFAKRRSCRAFRPEAMPLESAAALFEAAYGVVELAPFGDGALMVRRSVPSAGGLFPLEIYGFVRRVTGIEAGLYHYDVLGHGLQLLRSGDLFAEIEPVFYTFPFAREANIVLCLGAVFKRTQKKYGPRGYRYILLEAGHSGQNICLRAAELGLAALCMGGFVDSRLNAMLQLDSRGEGVVYTIAAGYAESQ